MGNVSTHTASAVGGTTLGAALLTILTAQFHLDPGLAGAWIVILGAVVAGPVLAYLAARAKTDPALKAALDTITAISAAQQANGHTPGQPEVEATVTATATAPATATVVATTPVAPPQNPAVGLTGPVATQPLPQGVTP